MDDLEEYRQALAAAQVGTWSWDVGADVIRWSEELWRLFGRTPGTTPPRFAGYLDMLHPEDRAHVEEAVRDALASAAAAGAPTSYVVVHRLVRPDDGSVRWIEGRGRVLVGPDGRPTRMTGTAIDVTRAKVAEEALRGRQEQFRLFTALASDYVYEVDVQRPALVPAIVAGAFERTTGFTPEAVAARGGWLEIVHQDDRAAVRALWPTLVAGLPAVVEYRIVDGAGNVRWLRDCVRPVADATSGQVTSLMGGVQDVTERKRLEEQLLHARKTEALAHLSGGIAHDFNNLLGVVLGSVDLVDRPSLDAEVRRSLGAIREAAHRAADLTRSLLVFARRDVGTPRTIELGAWAQGVVPFLEPAVGKGVQVEVVVRKGPHHVRIDPGQVQLLLLNLAVNARDALPRGGHVRILVDKVELTARDAGRPAELDPGRYVRLDVQDDGAGIPPHVLPRLFEPFFTTKPQGKGTGLGLAACHGIARQAGGAIQVSSVPGRGTTFSVLLPRLEDAEAPPEPAAVKRSTGGTESVLVVEDEPLLRRVATRILSDLGYRVLQSETAEAALVVLASEEVALLFSDLALPGMHGLALAREARARWPGLRLLLTSGNADLEALPPGVEFLQKPFTADGLARRVRAVLDG